MGFLSALFQMVSSIFGFGTKVIPSDKIREEKLNISIPRLTGQEKTKIYDSCFHDLRRHPEIIIETHINFVHDALNEDDKKELVELLTARLNADPIYHRKKFKKGIKYN